MTTLKPLQWNSRIAVQLEFQLQISKTFHKVPIKFYSRLLTSVKIGGARVNWQFYKNNGLNFGKKFKNKLRTKPRLLSLRTAKNVQVVNTSKSGSLDWQVPIPLAINCLCLLLVKQKIQSVLKILRNFPVDINHKERVEWIVFYLKNAWEM